MLYGEPELNALSEEIIRIARFEPIHMAVMLTYLRVTELRLGLLLNSTRRT